MSKIAATDKHSCEFCNRSFVRESTLLKHICEYKHRWLERDRRGNQIGFQSWLQFYTKNSLSKKVRTYEEFIKSAYYTAFVKFGAYSVAMNCVNVSRFVDFLLKENIKLDTWTSDANYTKFLLEYTKTENALDAVTRTVSHCLDLAEAEKLQPNDYLRYGNRNKICYAITTGRISPWVLYQSESGVKLLDELAHDQVKMVYDYINPVQWAIKFSKEVDKADEIKQLMTELKW
jgi:hypothetical protein